MEVGMTTAKVLQDLFDLNGKGQLSSPYEPNADSSADKGKNSQQTSRKERLRQLPKSVRKEVLEIIEKTPSTNKDKLGDSLNEVTKLSSQDFRKGFEIGVQLAKSPVLETGELSIIFEEVLQAQPQNVHMEGIYKGVVHQERIIELNKLRKAKSLSRGMER